MEQSRRTTKSREETPRKVLFKRTAVSAAPAARDHSRVNLAAFLACQNVSCVCCVQGSVSSVPAYRSCCVAFAHPADAVKSAFANMRRAARSVRHDRITRRLACQSPRVAELRACGSSAGLRGVALRSLRLH